MSKSLWAVFKLCAVIGMSGAGVIAPNSVESAQACRGGQGIGVHRTVNLNTSGGKRYGKSHGGAQDFLKHKEVVLTFDDGPVPNITPKVLHELDKHCAKATFFMVATMAKNNPSLARKVANKGHTVGIHSYSHKNLGQVSGPNAVKDVNRSITAIEKAVGRDVAPFFRFPYLSENRSVNQHLKGMGYGVFAIDVDSLDYKMKNPNSMVNRVMSELNRKGKGIILMHDIQKVTANGLGHLLDRLNKEGYKLVHIRGRGGKDPQDPILVSSVSEKKDKPKPTVVALTTPKKPISSWTLRKSVDVKESKQKASKKLLAKRKSAMRAKVKKRITVTSVKPVKVIKKQKVTSLSTQNTFKKNRAKALKQFNKNKQAFRSAIKMRIIN